MALSMRVTRNIHLQGREVDVATVLALSREAPEMREWSRIDGVSQHEPFVRSVYQPSGGARPVAALVSVFAVAGLLDAFT